MRVVGLGGGIGASRLWRALAATVGAPSLTLVVNTADDLWLHGLRVCPDLDTTLYALSGRQDTERGWGVRGESWRCMDALRHLGEDVWFNLGDLDLATHLRRTGLLRAGAGLASVTATLAAAMGGTARVLPMTEAEVTTRVTTDEGVDLHYEEFLVRHHATLPVRRVRYDGLSGNGPAQPAPGMLDALAGADVVVLGLSNPIASIGPILALPGIREVLRAVADRTVAVSPIVSGIPITEPGERKRAASRAALLAAAGVPATAGGVAGLYAGLCGRFVLDTADATEADDVTAHGVTPILAPTLLHGGAPPSTLVDTVLGVLS
ncbi:2-phospho-L-lactate transferase CofD family protein [Pseudonocardia sp. H11422]|uniref:2-phospho-L-lactate transferase CofD family protein n=1 Tax=Pseudonocardia sp. H11422 TaxID=2835866 RepID=UPI001BDD8EE1|nr:2-phospho-L-lactate transferase CofD family protein [Pseudonocardia sp. H11422]